MKLQNTKVFSYIHILAALFALSLAGYAGAQKAADKTERPIAATPAGSLTSESVAVAFDVNVTDSKGNLITGLTREHFKLFENDVELPVQVFEPGDTPVNVVLMVEFSSTTGLILEDVRAAAALLVRGLRPGDHVALVTFGSFPKIEMDFTNDFKAMDYRIAQLQFTSFPGVDLAKGLDFVLDRMKSVPGKRAVVLLGTGVSSGPLSIDKLNKRVMTAGTPIFAVSMGRHELNVYSPYISDSAKMALFQADTRMRQVAESSNGASYFPPVVNAFPNVIKDICLRLRHRYLLAYSPPDSANAKLKRKVYIDAYYDLDGDGKVDKLKVMPPRTYTIADRSRD